VFLRSKESEGCTWHERLACAVPVGKGRISPAIKMKDCNYKTLGCGPSPFFCQRGAGRWESLALTPTCGASAAGRLWPREWEPREECWAPQRCCSWPGPFPAADINLPPTPGNEGC